MGIQLTIVGADELIAKYKRMSSIMAQYLVATMRDEMTILADYVRANKLSGDPLHRRTGGLSRAVTGRAALTGTDVVGQIGTSGIPYAFVHEHGGVFMIPAHMRRVGYSAKEERIKMLSKTGKVRAAVKSMSRGMVRAHTADYPQRAFLLPSMQENRAKIIAALKATVFEVLREA